MGEYFFVWQITGCIQYPGLAQIALPPAPEEALFNKVINLLFYCYNVKYGTIQLSPPAEWRRSCFVLLQSSKAVMFIFREGSHADDDVTVHICSFIDFQYLFKASILVLRFRAYLYYNTTHDSYIINVFTWP